MDALLADWSGCFPACLWYSIYHADTGLVLLENEIHEC